MWRQIGLSATARSLLDWRLAAQLARNNSVLGETTDKAKHLIEELEGAVTLDHQSKGIARLYRHLVSHCSTPGRCSGDTPLSQSVSQ